MRLRGWEPPITGSGAGALGAPGEVWEGESFGGAAFVSARSFFTLVSGDFRASCCILVSVEEALTSEASVEGGVDGRAFVSELSRDMLDAIASPESKRQSAD